MSAQPEFFQQKMVGFLVELRGEIDRAARRQELPWHRACSVSVVESQRVPEASRRCSLRGAVTAVRKRTNSVRKWTDVGPWRLTLAAAAKPGSAGRMPRQMWQLPGVFEDCARICSLHNHAAIGPREQSQGFRVPGPAVRSASTAWRKGLVHQSLARRRQPFDEWRLAAGATPDMSSLNFRCITGI
jgi:hypothetical protein